MSNWALVIGVDRYDEPQNNLRAAVSDALRVSRWLLAPGGGNVPERQMRLLLSAHTPINQAPAALPANRLSIITAIEDVLKQSGGQGQRLFFYFAGHGLSARVDLTNLSAILPSDFRSVVPDQSISLRSLFDLFQSTQFAEQYFFFDACRDIAFHKEIRLGHYPSPRPPITPPPPQYVMYATQSGVKAMELLSPGNLGGAFTHALLGGLEGRGSAKRWNEATGQYEVRWNSLFRHVRAEVAQRKLRAGSGASGLLTQEPRRYGENAGDDPVLACLSPALIANETLNISVDPPTLVNAAMLAVRDLIDDHRAGPPLSLPHVLQLPPRTYSVSAVAPGYRGVKRANVVDLYEAQDVTIELLPTGPTDPDSMRADLNVTARSLSVDATDAARDVTLVVESSDSLARVELTSNSGALIAGERGRVSWTVKPGFYRTRVLSPEGDFVEMPLEVTGREPHITVRGEAPAASSPAMSALLKLGSFRSESDGSVEVSEAVGKAAFVQPSTVLAMAAAAIIEQHVSYGQRLRSLPLPSFHALTGGANSGALVLLGDEETEVDPWEGTTVSCVPVSPGSAISQSTVEATGVPGVFASAHALSPASYWLEIVSSNQRTLSMPLHVLPNHVALLVLMQTPQKGIEVYLYQFQATDTVTRQSYDPQRGAVRFAAIRRIELMQRNIANGRITPILPDLESMLTLEWLDPIAASLGCYALIRLGRWQDVRRLATALARRFPELPDAWVAYACYAQYAGHKAARDLSVKASQLGMSSFREGVTLLRRLLADTGADAAAERLGTIADSILPDSLWALSPAPLSKLQTAAVHTAARVR